MSKWCNLYNCFCEEVIDISEEVICDVDCSNCDNSEDIM